MWRLWVKVFKRRDDEFIRQDPQIVWAWGCGVVEIWWILFSTFLFGRSPLRYPTTFFCEFFGHQNFAHPSRKGHVTKLELPGTSPKHSLRGSNFLPSSHRFTEGPVGLWTKSLLRASTSGLWSLEVWKPCVQFLCMSCCISFFFWLCWKHVVF